MHPIEQLRYVARAAGADAGLLVEEAAMALGVFADDPPGLVTGCRRLLTRQPGIGPLWWLTSRLVTAGDPRREARAVSDELRADRTARHLAAGLPDGAAVVIAGWPALTLDGLRRRGDVTVFVVDVEGQGPPVVRGLEGADVSAEDIDPARVGGIVNDCDVVVVEAAAMGDSAALVDVGSLPAVAVARVVGRPVWMVAGVGRRLPERYWQTIVDRVFEDDPDWLAPVEVVPLGLVDRVVTPAGIGLPSELGPPDCPVAPELLKELQ